MFRSASFFLAKRYFLAKKNFFSKIFLAFSVSGIALGVYAMVVVLGVMKGFEETVRDRILGVNAHMVVYPPGGPLKSYEDVCRKLLGFKWVKGVYPFVQGQVMAHSEFGSSGCVLRGVNEGFFRLLKEKGWIKYGRAPGEGEVILGKDLARRLGVFVGDYVRFIGASGEFYVFAFVPKVKGFKVSGIFEVGLYDFDNGVAFGRLKDIMSFLNLSGVDGIEVYTDDPMGVDGFKGKVQGLLRGFTVATWKEMNRNLFSAMRLERIVMFVILGFMAVVASFGIITTLFLNVLERKRDIAVVKAFGGKSTLIRDVFLIEGLLIGALGTVLGLVFGAATVLFVEKFRLIRLPDVYLIKYLPAKLDCFYVAITVSISMALSLLGSILPARWASKIKPSEIIRHE